MTTLVESYIQQLKDFQKGKLWIGSSYQKKLEGITDEHAFLRPVKEMHSVAEIIAHLTTWRREAVIKIKTGSGTITDDDSSNWRKSSELIKIGWKELRLDYEKTLEELISVLEKKEDAFLDKTYYDTDFKGDYTYHFLLQGMIHHDAYHLGQLGYIIKCLIVD